MRILIVDGHPDRSEQRFCHALAAAYAEGARQSGHDVQVITIASMDTMGMPGLVYRWFFFKHSVMSLKRNVLELVGIRPVRETIIGMVETTDHRKWLTKVQALGHAAR